MARPFHDVLPDGVAPAAAPGERRVALVIGNGRYAAENDVLTNPRNDATAIAAALSRIGFYGVKADGDGYAIDFAAPGVEALHDLNQQQMGRALAAIERATGGVRQAVIYYAGHGIEAGGENYLIPVDAKLAHVVDAKFETQPLSRAVGAVDGAAGLRLVILDACRNNPFRARLFSGRDMGGGSLRSIEPPGNSLVAYAAKHGSVASDGKKGERNSPFAACLLRHIETPGLEVMDLFREVKDEVLEATHGAQEPHLYGSLGRRREYFVPPKEVEPPPPSGPVDPGTIEHTWWLSVSDTDDLRRLEMFLEKFPDGVYAELARHNAVELIDTDYQGSRLREALAAYPDSPRVPLMTARLAYLAWGAIAADKPVVAEERLRAFIAEFANAPEVAEAHKLLGATVWLRLTKGREPASEDQLRNFIAEFPKEADAARTLLTQTKWAALRAKGHYAPEDQLRAFIAESGGSPEATPARRLLADIVWARAEGLWAGLEKSRQVAELEAFAAEFSDLPQGKRARRKIAELGKVTPPPGKTHWLKIAAAAGIMIVAFLSLWGLWGARPQPPIALVPPVGEDGFKPNPVPDPPVPPLPPPVNPPAPVRVFGALEPIATRAPKQLTADEERIVKKGDEFQECADCPTMVVVPAGGFQMGSNDGQSNEKPPHWVNIAKPFAVGKFEVTFDNWGACVSGGGCTTNKAPGDSGWGRGNRPAINVTWNDAKEYVTWLSKKTRETYRLLSEAEWEYAARAGTTGNYAFGDTITNSQAQFNASSTVPVGSFKPNASGLFDVHGNIWEWVEDCQKDSYVGAPSDGTANLSGDCTNRMLRGGSWGNPPSLLRSSYRSLYNAGTAYNDIGFRVARTLDPQAVPPKVVKVDLITPPGAPTPKPTDSDDPFLELFKPGLESISTREPKPLTADEDRSLKRGTEFRECADCPAMVVVPAGDFTMGANDGEADEKPTRKVTIAKPFAVGKFEVTYDNWVACVSGGGCAFNKSPNDQGWGRGSMPVTNVSWSNAKEYVAWLSKRTGKTYRLLTEAEWEYAARAGTTAKYAFGDAITQSQAQFSKDRPALVGSFTPNSFGLYDMHGNASEWVEDCYFDSYKDAPNDGSARTCRGIGIPPTFDRTVRGGSYIAFASDLRSASRYGFSGVQNYIGFRVARTLDSASPPALPKSGKLDVTAPPKRIGMPDTARPPSASGLYPGLFGMPSLEPVATRVAQPLTAAEERGLMRGDEFRECVDCPTMVVVPAGSFTMGSNDQQNEKPPRKVTLAKAFAVGKFEVTFDNWAACVKDGGCISNKAPDDGSWGRITRPVINVSWNDAKEYTAWLSNKTKVTYRLLSEAEWEYAARAEAKTKYAFGDTITESQAQFDVDKTAAVGSFKPNAFGLYDMHGNVWEWIEDCSHATYDGAPADGSAWTTGACEKYLGNIDRMVRGGSYASSSTELSIAARFREQPTTRQTVDGFRVARTLSSAP